MFKLTKKKVAAGVAAAALVAMTGVGYAYWTSDGNGSGSATVGTDTPWQVTTDAAVGAALTPGGPTDTVDVHVKNNGSGVQRLEKLEVSVANSDGTTWDPTGTCSAADFSIGGEAGGVAHSETYTDDLASGETSTHTFSIQMIDTGANQDDCRTATVPLYVVAS